MHIGSVRHLCDAFHWDREVLLALNQIHAQQVNRGAQLVVLIERQAAAFIFHWEGDAVLKFWFCQQYARACEDKAQRQGDERFHFFVPFGMLSVKMISAWK